jgi:hypothetical protein
MNRLKYNKKFRLKDPVATAMTQGYIFKLKETELWKNEKSLE